MGLIPNNLASNIRYDPTYIKADKWGHSINLYLSDRILVSRAEDNYSSWVTASQHFKNKMREIASELAPNCGCENELGESEELRRFTNYRLSFDENNEPVEHQSLGGFVSVNSTAEKYAYIAPDAIVCGNSTIGKGVFIEGSTVKSSVIKTPFDTWDIGDIVVPGNNNSSYRNLLKIYDSEVDNSSIDAYGQIYDSEILEGSELTRGSSYTPATLKDERSDVFSFTLANKAKMKNSKLTGLIAVSDSTLTDAIVQNQNINKVYTEFSVHQSTLGITESDVTNCELSLTDFGTVPYTMNIDGSRINKMKVTNLDVNNTTTTENSRVIASASPEYILQHDRGDLGTSFIQGLVCNDCTGTMSNSSIHSVSGVITFPESVKNFYFSEGSSLVRGNADMLFSGSDITIVNSKLQSTSNNLTVSENVTVRDSEVKYGSSLAKDVSISNSDVSNSSLGEGVSIRSNSFIYDSNLGAAAIVSNSHVTNSTIGENTSITDSSIVGTSIFENKFGNTCDGVNDSDPEDPCQKRY